LKGDDDDDDDDDDEHYFLPKYVYHPNSTILKYSV
jgi:hypothetical protein